MFEPGDTIEVERPTTTLQFSFIMTSNYGHNREKEYALVVDKESQQAA